jgi:ubiquitin-protein ligase
MTSICKYYSEINDIIRDTKWKNDISLINCIDNDTYFNIQLKFNDIIINIITDFKYYCTFLNTDDMFTELNFKIVYYTDCNISNVLFSNVLYILDNYKKKEYTQSEYIDKFNFFQDLKPYCKYNINCTNIKLKSNKHLENKNNTHKINIPKNLLFNEQQIFTILINEITKINSDKSYKHYIIPYENNIYDLRTKIFFTDIVLEIKFIIDPKLYPFYPPQLEIISPKLSLQLILSLMNLSILKLNNWNYTISFEWLIENLYNLLNPIINDHIINDSNIENNELSNLLIKLALLTNDNNNFLDIDIKFNKTTVNKTLNTYWKSGTGYGNDNSTKWDIKNYILEKEVKENEIKVLLKSINTFFDDNTINLIINSSLLKYISNTIDGITLLSVDSNKIIFEEIMKILDSLFDYITLIPIDFIKYIVTNMKNINEDIETLFINNEQSLMNFLYQAIHNNYIKYYDYIKDEIKDDTNIYVIDNNVTKTKEELYIDIMKTKQFEINDYDDPNIIHLYKDERSKKMSSKSLTRIISELSTLKLSLPLNYDSTIWMKVSKKNMNIYTFMISGPKDTPYENGLFLFHGCFPQIYPDSEPKVLIQTTGMGKVRFNPNLYASGKVCLSLLGTWSGDNGEKWNNKTSSFLQVLVSIQSLIFVENPYFNEPGYEKSMGTTKGNKLNFEYNEIIRYHTIELAIINQILNPPVEYQEIIHNHFRIKKDDILQKCEMWVNEAISQKVPMENIYIKLKKVLNSLS